MNKYYFTLLITSILLGFETSAQIKKANALFYSYNYSQAIPYYLKIAKEADNKDRNEAIANLADCYRLTNDQLNAKTWYSQAVKLPDAKPINWFYYGQALRSAQEYDLAKEAFLKYAELAPSDPRGKTYAGFCSQVENLTDLPALFEVKNALSINSDRSDYGPAFYNEGIIFVSDRFNDAVKDKSDKLTNSISLDMYFARPRFLDEFFQELNDPKSFAGQFNQTSYDGPATFAKHDSLIYFTRSEASYDLNAVNSILTNKMKIYWSVKTNTWSKPEPFILNSDSYSVGHPFLSPDGKTLYFASDMPGGFGGTDIYYCEWKNDKWSQPKNLGSTINSFGNEMFPSISDGNLYFASDGLPGFGGLDIFFSKSEKGKWSKPENIGLPMNSPFDDFSLVLDTFGKKGFFSSNRPGGVGKEDIYACKRLDRNSKLRSGMLYTVAAKTDSTTITGYVKDKVTQKPMPGSIVFLVNTVKGKAKVLRTDANGKYKSTVEKGIFYLAKGMENKYLADCLSFEIAADDTAHKAKTPRDLLLDQLALNKVFTFNTMNIENIYFDFNKTYIRPDAKEELDKLVKIMKENPVSIELGTYTDSRGSDAYNLELSQKRAESVVQYIIQKGIEPGRIKAKGYGETKLTNRCSDGVPCSEEEHQANRRTEFKVIGFNTVNATGDFDLNKFIAGDEIPVYMFDKDFYINCLQNNTTDARKVPAKVTPPAESTKTPAKTIQPTEPAKVAPKVTQPAEQPKSTGKTTQASEAAKIPEKTTKPANTVKAEPVVTIEKPNEKQSENNKIPGNPSITFRVQLFSLSRSIPMNSADFDALKDIQQYEEDGLYKYTAGIFGTYEEARAYRDSMVADGFADSFVVKFENGKHVNMAQVNK